MKTLLKIYLPASIILVAAFLICYSQKWDPEVLMSDPLGLANVVPWAGAVSNIGILIWSIPVSVCFFTGACLSRQNRDKDRIHFLYMFGTITAVIMLDDFFMLHEFFYRHYLHLNQNLVFACYGLAILAGFLKFRKIILGSRYSLLIASLGFFALSAGFDVLWDYHVLPGHQLYEDGSKLLGIFSWAGYFVTLCSDFLSPEQ